MMMLSIAYSKLPTAPKQKLPTRSTARSRVPLNKICPKAIGRKIIMLSIVYRPFPTNPNNLLTHLIYILILFPKVP